MNSRVCRHTCHINGAIVISHLKLTFDPERERLEASLCRNAGLDGARKNLEAARKSEPLVKDVILVTLLSSPSASPRDLAYPKFPRFP